MPLDFWELVDSDLTESEEKWSRVINLLDEEISFGFWLTAWLTTGIRLTDFTGWLTGGVVKLTGAET